MSDRPFADLAAFVALPRLVSLALSCDGNRLVAAVQQPDEKGARYSSALWEIDPSGAREPVRLTRSVKGESSPAFRPDGSLLFLSARPGPDGDDDDDETALWVLPETGEPHLLARNAGGVGGPVVVAAATGTVVASGGRLVGSTAGDDAERRKTRKERKISAILHTGMPIRHWDHELGEVSQRLLCVGADGEARDITADAGFALDEANYSISADGRTVVSSWRERRRGGRFDYVTVAIDVATGERTTVAEEDGVSFCCPRISPDGNRVAVSRQVEGSYDTPMAERLQIGPLDGTPRVTVDVGDLFPSEWVWSRDSQTLFVSGDLHGRGTILSVDAATGAVICRLVSDAVYASLCPSPDGRYVYALRSATDCAPTPVRLDVTAEHQTPELLATPAPTPTLPGTLIEVQTRMPDEAVVHGWLCLPPRSEQPAPVMLWIHGGPFASYNSWSWRWNPWVAVAHGWAVLLPDPALSTGYGQGWFERAWPHRAAAVWNDLETMLDAVLERPEIDANRTVCLGGSFGGYMSNWIAGHTDRFDAIVTHAGLWALDQQHATTDAAQWKTGIFGTPAQHPDWYAENSPNNFVADIRTPMLVVHGNRDYRVPIGEALRLWWDVVSHFDGEPESMPHRFLQLTGENHWVLSPANAQVWYDAVLGFCGEHALGRPWTPTALL